MKKKEIFLKVTLIALILIIGLLFYSEKINKIEIIENIKNAMNEQLAEQIEDTANSLSEIEEPTVIDVTNLERGEGFDHDHLFKTMYDETNHWEECTICGEKNNIANHSFTRTWASTSTAQCHKDNYYTDTCKCGYSYIGHKPCVWDGKTFYKAYTSYSHGYTCKVCNDHILYTYYLNSYGNGKLYNGITERCYKSDGTTIDCKNLGRCEKCGYNYTQSNHLFDIYKQRGESELICEYCKNVYGTVTHTITNNSIAPATYTIITNLQLKNGATYKSTGGLRNVGNPFQTINTRLTSGSVGGTNITLTSTATFKTSWKSTYGCYLRADVNIDGGASAVFANFIVSPDPINPTITSITMENSEELTEWSRTKPIIIQGTENYCNTVNVQILNDDDENVFYGTATVTNGRYSISCTPEIEAGLKGRNFKAIVTDACNNRVEKDFVIERIDVVAPKITTPDEVGGDWAKSKNFTFTAIDKGIGNVSIAFNDISDYKLAAKDEDNYSREYKFVGDAYEPKTAIVIYKDELGNISTKDIVIDKIDNTVPTITNASLSSNKLTIIANDEHETLGEGSGVTKYKYITSDTRLVNPEVTEDWKESSSNEIVVEDVYKAKYIYVVAEDLVGNISSVYEIILPELILDTEVDLSLSNEKGGVNLDWTGYDSTNKVFKAYHRKDDVADADWETILDNDNVTKFTDNLAQDVNAPDAPTMSAGQVGITKDIQISFNTKDNGSTYSFYVEAYDSVDTSIKLSVSNERTELVTTGVKGYYYIIDEDSSNKDFDITSAEVKYTTDENILVHISNNGKYIHMKADDVAGNISEPSTYKIDLKIIDIDEEITIELTKTWIDNDIQRARRPDKLRFVVVPVKESDELKTISSNNNVSEVNTILSKEDSTQNNSEELKEEILQGKIEQDNTIKENIKPEESNKESTSWETQSSSLDEEKAQGENSSESLEENNNKTKENQVETTTKENITTENIAEKSNKLQETHEILNKSDETINEKTVSEKVENTVKPSELESIENITNSNKAEVLDEDNINENQVESKTENIIEDKKDEVLAIEDTKIEDKLETPKLDTTQVNNEITLEENPVDIEEGIESYTYEFEVDKTVLSQVFNLSGILKYDQTTGKPMKYIIKEEEVNEGDLKFYETTGGEVEKIADSEGNIIKYTAEIINKFKLPEGNTKEVKVTKIWNDDNQIAIRPTRVILELIGRVKDIKIIEESETLNIVEQQSDAEETPKQEEKTNEVISENDINSNELSYKTISSKEGTVSSETEWKHTYTGLPIYDENGQEIEYIAQEKQGQDELNKYISEVSKINEANEITVTNSLIIRNSIITKTGPEEITSVDSNVPYNIDYEVELDNKYTENMIIEIVDTLPYQIEEEKSNLKGGIYNYNEGTKIATITWRGTYNPVSKTITWENGTEISAVDNPEEKQPEINLEVIENADKNTQTIKVHIDMNVTYKNINVLNEKIINKVSGKITLSNNEKEKVESIFETRTRWIRNITVTKFWKGDTEETRPESIELQLSASTKDENNQDIEYVLDESIEKTKILSKDMDWTGTLWTNLPSYDESGKEINYTVEEINIEGYKSEILEINKNFSDIEITVENTKLYKLPITGGIGVDTIRSLEVLVGIIVLIVLTNRKKIIPSRRSVIKAKREKVLKKLALKYNNK